MRVTLDQDQWDIGAAATIGEVLAEVSDRAQAKSRIVTSLQLDYRTITDRDLDAVFLREPARKYSVLTAASLSRQELAHSVRHSAERYAQIVHEEGRVLAGAFRAGLFQVAKLDLWLGQLADYLELVEGTGTVFNGGREVKPLSAWVRDLLDARAGQDIVMMADLLEYEILPRLATKEC
ncbi:MAG: hypothetical protein HP492_00950 [Nitrospira sp.]|nr:hypothetical protein [Nitrospira sp.]MBH0206600.1 hypothetical protein [Nitrospira sp.]